MEVRHKLCLKTDLFMTIEVYSVTGLIHTAVSLLLTRCHHTHNILTTHNWITILLFPQWLNMDFMSLCLYKISRSVTGKSATQTHCGGDINELTN